MKKLKIAFAVAITLATIGSTATAATVMYNVTQQIYSKPTDSRVILGHRVAPNGQEVLVYAR